MSFIGRVSCLLHCSKLKVCTLIALDVLAMLFHRFRVTIWDTQVRNGIESLTLSVAIFISLSQMVFIWWIDGLPRLTGPLNLLEEPTIPAFVMLLNPNVVEPSHSILVSPGAPQEVPPGASRQVSPKPSQEVPLEIWSRQ